MDEKTKEYIIQELIKLPKIRKIYDDYIIKEISYEDWVRDTVLHLLGERHDAGEIIDKIIKEL